MEQQRPTPDHESLFKETVSPGFFAEFWYFIKTSRKWWLLPLLALFLLLGIMLVLAKTAIAPFIYTLF